jgi:hypothetical protein
LTNLIHNLIELLQNLRHRVSGSGLIHAQQLQPQSRRGQQRPHTVVQDSPRSITRDMQLAQRCGQFARFSRCRQSVDNSTAAARSLRKADGPPLSLH